MINAELMRNKGILIVSPVDDLSTTDFDQVRNLVNPYLEKHGDLKAILVDADSFPGWESFASLLSHLNFVNDYEKKVKRVAVVSDSNVLTFVPKIVDYFVSAEVEVFSYQDRNKAINWAATGQKA